MILPPGGETLDFIQRQCSQAMCRSSPLRLRRKYTSTCSADIYVDNLSSDQPPGPVEHGHKVPVGGKGASKQYDLGI